MLKIYIKKILFHIFLNRTKEREREREREGILQSYCEFENSYVTLYIIYNGSSNLERILRARNARADRNGSGIKCRGNIRCDVRTSLRTGWRTVGHDDLGLRLRRALAHGSFDTSSIFHRSGVGNTKPPLPVASRSSVR